MALITSKQTGLQPCTHHHTKVAAAWIYGSAGQGAGPDDAATAVDGAREQSGA